MSKRCFAALLAGLCLFGASAALADIAPSPRPRPEPRPQPPQPPEQPQQGPQNNDSGAEEQGKPAPQSKTSGQ